jgi:hypothetical protein
MFPHQALAQRLHLALFLICLNTTTRLDFLNSYDPTQPNNAPAPVDPNLQDILAISKALYIEVHDNFAGGVAALHLRDQDFQSFNNLYFDSAPGAAAYGSPASCPCTNGQLCDLVQALI